MAIGSQGHGDPSSVLRILKKLSKFGKLGGNHEKGNLQREPSDAKKKKDKKRQPEGKDKRKDAVTYQSSQAQVRTLFWMFVLGCEEGRAKPGRFLHATTLPVARELAEAWFTENVKVA